MAGANGNCLKDKSAEFAEGEEVLEGILLVMAYYPLLFIQCNYSA
jgi:hypothetical protein